MTKILYTHCYGEQRIEVVLTNGQSFSVMVDKDTGKVSLLSDNPHVIGNTVKAVDLDSGLPRNAVEVNYYGYPSD